MPEAHRALGYFRQWCEKDFDGALEEFRAAVRLGPNDGELLHDLGLALKSKGRWDEAIAAFERALSFVPSLGAAILANLGAEAGWAPIRVDGARLAAQHILRLL